MQVIMLTVCRFAGVLAPYHTRLMSSNLAVFALTQKRPLCHDSCCNCGVLLMQAENTSVVDQQKCPLLPLVQLAVVLSGWKSCQTGRV